MTTSEQTAVQKHEQEKIAKANEPKTRCLVCKFETSPKMRCICLPAGGPTDQQTDYDHKPAKEVEALAKTKVPENKPGHDVVAHRPHEEHKKHQKPTNEDIAFNPDIIRDLILRNLLIIDNKSDLGVFNVSCQKFYHLEPQQKVEVQKFFRALLKSHQDFIHDQHLQEKNCPLQPETDSAKNIIAIRVSTLNPNVYDAFIRHLKQRELLLSPKPVYKQPEEMQVQNQHQKKFNPTPFAMVPKPKGFEE